MARSNRKRAPVKDESVETPTKQRQKTKGTRTAAGNSDPSNNTHTTTAVAAEYNRDDDRKPAALPSLTQDFPSPQPGTRRSSRRNSPENGVIADQYQDSGANPAPSVQHAPQDESWIRRIKEQTLAQFPRQTVKTWTPFFTTVAMFLRQTNLKINIDEKIVNTMVGLASFGVENQESLLAAAGNKMDGVLFDTRLKPMGVPGLICAMLFTEFVESKALTLLDVCSI